MPTIKRTKSSTPSGLLSQLKNAVKADPKPRVIPVPNDTRMGKPIPNSDEYWEFRNVLEPKPVTTPRALPDEMKQGPHVKDRWTEFRDNLSAKPHRQPTRQLADDSCSQQAVLDMVPNNPKGFGRTKGKRR